MPRTALKTLAQRLGCVYARLAGEGTKKGVGNLCPTVGQNLLKKKKMFELITPGD